MSSKIITCSILTLLIITCCSQEQMEEDQPPFKILHLSHTRSGNPGEVFSQLRNINYTDFDVLCLGGDIDENTSLDSSTMLTWDSLFAFGKERTLWTLGNHDVANRQLVSAFTHRPSFYTWSVDQLRFIVLDSQENQSNISGQQLDLLTSVIDTISQGQYLIVLTHKLIWMPGNDDLEGLIDSIPNGKAGDCLFCTNPNNFYHDVYPLLRDAREKGVEVICIAGDIGIRVKEFEFKTKEGIYFLASGIDYRKADNKVLIVEYHKHLKNCLHWKFECIDNL